MEIKKGNKYYAKLNLALSTNEGHILNVLKGSECEVISVRNDYLTFEIDNESFVFTNENFEEKFTDVQDEEKKEMVNHPKHYGGDTQYECIKVLKAWLSPDEYKGFLKGNAIKYLCRTGKKDETVQELKKALWYIQKLIEVEEE